MKVELSKDGLIGKSQLEKEERFYLHCLIFD